MNAIAVVEDEVRPGTVRPGGLHFHDLRHSHSHVVGRRAGEAVPRAVVDYEIGHVAGVGVHADGRRTG